MSLIENKSFHKTGVDKLKLYVAIVSVVIGVVGFNLGLLKNVFAQAAVFSAFSLIGVVSVFSSAYGRQFIVFFKEAKIELRRVVWPTMTETKQMTFAVIVVIALTIIFLMVVDGLLRYLLQLFISLR
jgi:preprotein translocase subunit SecE